MTHRRLVRLATSSVSLAWILGTYALACGGDDDGGGTSSGNDAATTDATNDTTTGSGDDGSPSTGPDATPPDAGPTLDIDASAAAATVYAGQTASFDASSMLGGAATTFAWTLTSAPTGSAVTSASITGATSAAASLPTDKTGAYVVSVTATANGQTATATITLTAAPANVVYGVSTQVDGGFTGAAWVVNSDGTNAHAITCAPALANDPVSGATGDTQVRFAAASVADTFEGNAGTPTGFVFGGAGFNDAGTDYAPLYITDTSASCDGGSGIGAQLLYTGSVPGTTASGAVIGHARFSPDGTQVAFTVSTEAGQTPDVVSQIVVVNRDGSNPSIIGSIGEPDGGTAETADLGLRRQVEWIDSTHVAWTRDETKGSGSTPQWSFVSSSVPATGAPRTVMTCTGVAPNRAQFLASGAILAVVRPNANSPADLVLYQPGASGVCSVAHKFTSIDAGAGQNPSEVTAFAVSPDGNTVAFAVHNSGQLTNDPSDISDYGIVYTAPTDFSSAPVAVGTGAIDGAGLRWVGGGTQLAFTHYAADDAGQPTGTPSVAVVPVGAVAVAPDASTTVAVADLVQSTATTAVTAVGSGDGGGCNASGSSGSAFASPLLALVGLAFVRRRRARVDVDRG